MYLHEEWQRVEDWAKQDWRDRQEAKLHTDTKEWQKQEQQKRAAEAYAPALPDELIKDVEYQIRIKRLHEAVKAIQHEIRALEEALK